MDILLSRLQQQRQRQLLWLSGSWDWCSYQALQVHKLMRQGLTSAGTPARLHSYWVQASYNPKQQPQLPADMHLIQASASRTLLGSEQQLLVIDAFSGLHPDALGALSGTLTAGGLLVLLTPADWPSQPDPDYQRCAAWPYTAEQLSWHFLQRCARLLREYQVPRLSQDGSGNLTPPELATPPLLTLAPGLAPALPYAAASKDQADLVERLLNWFNNQPQVPVVITAHRGRGKSGALGLFIQQLLQATPLAVEQPPKVLVTAPAAVTTHAVFARLEQLSPDQQTQVSFWAPDALLQHLPPADLLLIDEAAALPVSVLQKLLAAYPTSVFATTQQGYEGNGRGFALRFTQHLQQHTPGWLALELHQPLRWAANDPLEKLTNRLLLLDAEITDPPASAQLSKEQLSFSWLNPAELSHNEALLQQVFGLLVLAHYRTSPDNLRQLLDAPGMRLACAWYQQLPVALALIQTEGQLDAALAQAVFMGTRRPQGHLLAQSLAFHAGFPEAAQASWWRIQRLLVHPNLQRQGLGSQLLDFVITTAQQEPNLDLIGTSFGATADLCRFWLSNNYMPVRLGLTQDKTSGETSLQLVQAVSSTGHQLQQQLVQRFTLTLPATKISLLQRLDTELLLTLLLALPLPEVQLNAQDKRELTAFTQGHRALEVSRSALNTWLQQELTSAANKNLVPKSATYQQLALWVALLKQQLPAHQLIQHLGLTNPPPPGKKALDGWLRKQLAFH